MARGPSKFRQRDVARAVRAARQGGLEVERVDFTPDGSFSVVIKDNGKPKQNYEFFPKQPKQKGA
jgi:hypothetical protein